MEPQFRDTLSLRDGSMVEVQVRYEQGKFGTGEMDEKDALERAMTIIERRISELDASA